jgi:hypothetical protein
VDSPGSVFNVVHIASAFCTSFKKRIRPHSAFFFFVIRRRTSTNWWGLAASGRLSRLAWPCLTRGTSPSFISLLSFFLVHPLSISLADTPSSPACSHLGCGRPFQGLFLFPDLSLSLSSPFRCPTSLRPGWSCDSANFIQRYAQ